MNAAGDTLLPVAARRLYQRILYHRAHPPAPGELARSALIVAPHADDETLGCGGTLLRKRAAGASLYVAYATDGSASHRHLIAAETLRQVRRREALEACRVLGVAEDHVAFLDYEDGRLSSHIPSAAQDIAALLRERRPHEVYVPYRLDAHPDHQATRQAVLSALRAYSESVDVYEYPVWYWMHWPWAVWPMGRRSYPEPIYRFLRIAKDALTAAPRFVATVNCRVDVTEVLALKREALARHRSQMTRLQPTPRWWTLPDQSRGEWLRCFAQPFEWFCRYHVPGSQS